MLKPSPILQGLLRRLPLSPKQAGKDFYKGNRVGSMGTIDKHGNFHPDFQKIRTYVYPVKGVKDLQLTPFVASSTQTVRHPEAHNVGDYEPYPTRLTGEQYLRMWKERGGHDVVEGYERQPQIAEIYEGPATGSSAAKKR